MSKSQQRKSRSGELELCRFLQDYGIPAEPGAAFNYGKEPDIKGVAGIHCECKRAEALRLSEGMAQAVRDSEKFHDGLPTLFHRRNRSPWTVTMRLEDWMAIYKGQHCNERGSESGH